MPNQRKIRVLIVDDIAETRENIKRSLQFDAEIEVIGSARNGAEGIQLAKEYKPDVIVMDINMPDMDGITVTEEIRKIIPSAQIIILSVQGDPSYMRRAMLVGARDFLTKPPSIDELISAIHRAGEMAIEQKEKEIAEIEQRTQISAGKTGGAVQGMVIAVYAPKGGVGCTTIATNLAVALVSGNRKVLLVDANTQFGDVAVFLNIQARNSIVDLIPRADELDDEVIQNVVTLHPGSGLNILPAPPNPEYDENIDGEKFSRMLDFLRGIYEYIVVDTNSFLSETVQSSLSTADVIVLLTSQDIPSIKNASLFLSLADATGISRQRILFVMNHYDKRIGITPERVGENLKQEIALTIPYDDRLMVNASINKGVPMLLENKGHPLSKNILLLSTKVREKLTQIYAPDK